MDKTAIEQIQLSQAVAETQKAIELQGLLHPLLAAHKDFSLTSLERYLPNKMRFTGSLATKSIGDFANFSLANKSEGTQCFIDKDSASATVIFNLGNTEIAGHADFTATLNLEKTAEYKALLNCNEKQLSQKQLAEFMEDWADFITPLDKEGEPINIARAVSAVRRLTIEANAKADHEVQDFRSSRSALENIEAKTEHGLPAELLFECVPFNELPEHCFYVRLSVITGEEPKLSFRIKRLEKAQDRIMEEFKVIVEDKLHEEIPTYMGIFKV